MKGGLVLFWMLLGGIAFMAVSINVLDFVFWLGFLFFLIGLVGLIVKGVMSNAKKMDDWVNDNI